MLCEPDEEGYSSGDDEDYLPSGESSGEEFGDNSSEDGCPNAEGDKVKGQGNARVKKKKRKMQQNQETKRQRTGGIRLKDDNDVATATTDENGKEDMTNVFKEEEQKAAEIKKEEQKQKKADDLWSSFMKDVGQKPKVKPQVKAEVTTSSGKEDQLGKESLSKSSGDNKVVKDNSATTEGKKTVTITKVYDFAGEAVKVTEEVAADSKEAKELFQPSKTAGDVVEPSAPQTSTAGPKRPAGGLSSVLGLINKKPKMSVLEKSRLDWNSFTATQGITDDLKLHNRGKEGYVEKQTFLAEADRRQYEKERDLRMGQSKR